MESTPRNDAPAETNSSGAMLLISWLFVGLPLIWGVSQTFIKALALFQ